MNSNVRNYSESLIEARQQLEQTTNNMLDALNNDADSDLSKFDLTLTIEGKEFKLLLTADLYEQMHQLLTYQIDES